jgi:hypothetical protein
VLVTNTTIVIELDVADSMPDVYSEFVNSLFSMLTSINIPATTYVRSMAAHCLIELAAFDSSILVDCTGIVTHRPHLPPSQKEKEKSPTPDLCSIGKVNFVDLCVKERSHIGPTYTLLAMHALKHATNKYVDFPLIDDDSRSASSGRTNLLHAPSHGYSGSSISDWNTITGSSSSLTNRIIKSLSTILTNKPLLNAWHLAWIIQLFIPYYRHINLQPGTEPTVNCSITLLFHLLISLQY